MLNGFQTDLSSISSEIQTLQQQSVAMNQRLKNRQAVRGELSQFVDEMVVPDAMITSVSTHASFLNSLTPTVVIWAQLSRILCLPDRVKPSFVIFDIRPL